MTRHFVNRFQKYFFAKIVYKLAEPIPVPTKMPSWKLETHPSEPLSSTIQHSNFKKQLTYLKCVNY
jgi:hypothetical protein